MSRPVVKIHVDNNAVKPVKPGNHCITVCAMDGTILERGDRLEITGKWVLRQYRNPTPCGASVVLHTEDESATYNLIKRSPNG